MMVMCTMESALIPRPPPLSGLLKREEKRSGFRLLENANSQDDATSVYSVYKQKIDAMFESDASSSKNSVQARIEKMFTDVAFDSGIPVNGYGCHSFSVDYLGSVPLLEKVTSLTGLQRPLRDLYFAYKRITKHKKSLTGRLEISASGLKVQYQGEKGDLEQLNSFPTIAVWSAVKFVLHEDTKYSYAFLPLITDPENIDKQQLFRTLDANERRYINVESHSPLFAVVMRKIGVHKQLECHGFVCQTSEDAIVIAATLYKSLMSHMKAKDLKKPRNRNGVTCMSVASSVFNEDCSIPVRPPRKKRSSSSSVVSDIDTIDTETVPLLQDSSTSQYPKKSTKNRRAPRAPPTTNKKSEDLDAIKTYEEDAQDSSNQPKLPLGDKWNTYKSNHQKQITAEIKQVIGEGSNMGLKRVKSLRKRAEEVKTADNSGDILTKVTIPRSGSFLNAGGLTRLNGQATGGSPLGFNELFNEFRLQEGLHSMDEILGVIIDPDGMSFNDLKPIYKEFLLKLAVTLTKDELYQRSKSIMRRQKKKLVRRTSNHHQKKRSVVVCSRFKRLKHVFQKLKNGKVAKDADEEVVKGDQAKLPESTISSSSYDTRHFTPKTPVTRKQSYRKRETIKRDRQSTSEESDFFSLRKSKVKAQQHVAHNNHNRNSSSGYVSCSECSFDSDTCTCVSADKCYCSLGQKNFEAPPTKKCCCQVDNEDSLTWCGCDTDSCTDSNKCYCTRGARTGTIFEQLKRRGFIPSAESASTPPQSRKLCKKNSNTKSTKSLEYMPNPTEKYYEKLKPSGRKRNDALALDYDLFTITSGGGNLRNNRALYMRSISESGHLCKESIRSRLTERAPNMVHKAAGQPGACTEALSVKKSAEIAALFADIKLSQTTDIAQMMPRHHDAYKSRFLNGRVVSNSMYSSTKSQTKNLYSTKNGLYTIQSQSDDSSRGKSERDYFNVKQDFKQKVSLSMENSLGYLP